MPDEEYRAIVARIRAENAARDEAIRAEIEREAEGSPGPRFYSLGDVYDADVPPVEGFLGDDLLARETVNMIAGRREAGKTYLVLSLAAAIAFGRDFGPMKTRKGRVLFISQEMSLKGIKRRIRKLLSREEARAFEQRVVTLFKYPVRIDTDEGADALRALIEAAAQSGARIDVVIIDALSDIKGSAKEDSNDDMGASLRRVRDRVAEPLDCCVLIVHHKGKPSDTERGGRGASAIEDVLGECIYLDRQTDGSRIGRFAKTRDDEVKPFRFDIKDDFWPDGTRRLLLTVTQGKTEASLSPRLPEVAAIVLEAPGLIQTKDYVLAVRDRLGVGDRTAKSLIGAAVYAKLIRSAGRGKYGPPLPELPQ